MTLQKTREYTKERKSHYWNYRASLFCDWFLHVSRPYPYLLWGASHRPCHPMTAEPTQRKIAVTTDLLSPDPISGAARTPSPQPASPIGSGVLVLLARTFLPYWCYHSLRSL